MGVKFGPIITFIFLSLVLGGMAQFNPPQGTVISRHALHGWLGVQVTTKMNASDDFPGATWYRTVQAINIVSRAKQGATLFSIRHPSGALNYLLWRDLDNVLTWSKLTSDSTPASFTLISDWNEPKPIDFTFGNRYFDVLGNSQNITLFVNISGFARDPPFSCNYTVSTINFGWEQYNVSDTPWSFIPDEEYTVPFRDMMDGSWSLWSNISFRLEALNPTIYAFAIPVYILVAILLITFSRTQPLLSRGIIPHISNIMAFIVFLSAARNWTSSEAREYAGCIMDMLISGPMTMTAAVCGVMIYSRYNIMRLINESKEFIIKKKNHGGSARNIMLKFFQFSQKWYTQLTVIVFVYISMAFIYIISSPMITTGNYRDCSYQRIVLLSFISIAFFIMLCNIPIDIYLTRRQIMKCDLKALFWNDPLNFKFEIWILYVFIYIYAVVVQLSVPRTLYPGEYWKIIIWTFQYFLMIWFHIWYPLIMSIIRWIQTFQRLDQVKKDKLGEILSDPEGLRLMYRFARSEFASENVSCYEDMMLYEKEEDWDTRKMMAYKIYDLYFCGASAPLEVNVTTTSIAALKQEMEKGTYQMHMFAKIKTVILENLCDTFARMSATPEFKQYRSEKAFLNDWDISHRKTFFEKNRNMTILQQPLVQNQVN
jgi:hypothetical protein